MGITLAKIASNTASATFEYETQHEDGSRQKDSVTVSYYPGRVTEKVIAALNGFGALGNASPADVEAQFVTFNAMLVHLLKSWDVYEDEAQTVMFPLEAARLAELPFAFRMQVVNVIMADMRPNSATL